MDLTEFTRFASDYGFVPGLFKVSHAKEIFATANLSEQRDDSRRNLSFEEFEFAVKRCIAEAFGLAPRESLPEGVTALWELLHEKDTPAKSIVPSPPAALTFRPLTVMGYHEDLPGSSTLTEVRPEYPSEANSEAEISQARVDSRAS